MGTVKRWFNALATMALTAICEAGIVSHLTDEESEAQREGMNWLKCP